MLDKYDFESDISMCRSNPYFPASMMREFHSNEASSEDKYNLTENLIISPVISHVLLPIKPNQKPITRSLDLHYYGCFSGFPGCQLSNLLLL